MNKSFRKGSLDNYTYYSNGSYIDIGQSICGNPDYDVVTQVYGGKWRMPSSSEVKELFDNCTLEPLQSDGYGSVSSTYGMPLAVMPAPVTWKSCVYELL